MKNLNFLFIALFLAGANSCTKKETNNPAPYTPLCLIQTRSTSDGLFESFSYDEANRISKYTFSFSGGDISSNYVYYKNRVEVEDDGGSFTTYYLNSNGFADSALIEYNGSDKIRNQYTYNANNELIKLVIIGKAFGSTINRTYSYEYENGNLVKQTLMEGNVIQENISEYYLDKINYSKPSEEKEKFINGNRNLVKKTTYPNGSYFEHTYSFDSDGKALTQTSYNSKSKDLIITTFSWLCK
jgi:hypothetical protein